MVLRGLPGHRHDFAQEGIKLLFATKAFDKSLRVWVGGGGQCWAGVACQMCTDEWQAGPLGGGGLGS